MTAPIIRIGSTIYIFEVSKVVADASAFTIAYHYKITIDGVQKFDRDVRLTCAMCRT